MPPVKDQKDQKDSQASAPAPSRREQALAQASEQTDPRERYKLAPALSGGEGVWTPVAGGHVGVTRHTAGEGADAKVTDYLTFIPARGRVQSVPLFALYAVPEGEV